MPASEDPKLLVLFDGVCNFCNDAVLFLIDRDPRERLRFASLQSDVGERTLREHALPNDMDTVVVVEEGRAYTRSTAALRVARQLRFPWFLLYAAIIVPRVVRDWVYRTFAKNRYKWFGKSDQCRIPTPDLRRRFLG